MKNIIKKAILIIILILLIGFVCQKTYATFFSKTSIGTDIDIASWNIFVNGSNITEDKDISLNEITWSSNHTNPLTVAPGSVGEFYIKIDPSDTDVAVMYEITVNDKSIDNNKVLTVTNVTNETEEFVEVSENVYKGLISLDEKDIHNIKFNVEWINSEENNDFDSAIGLDHVEPDYLEINFKAIQYNGEE